MDFPSKQELQEMPTQDLAYIGDAVYELYVRQVCLERYKLKPAKLHRIVIQYVNAGYQAQAARSLPENLSEAEKNILRRGRNANPGTKAKNASIEDYRLASGLEALLGYVYLAGDFPRLEELLKLIVPETELNANLEINN